jgi:predicted DNA-binding protein
MASSKFSISMPPEVRDRLALGAAEAGLDMSTYITIAVQAEMDRQDHVARVLDPVRRAWAEDESAAEVQDSWTDGIELTEAEQAEVDAALGRPSGGRGAAA